MIATRWQEAHLSHRPKEEAMPASTLGQLMAAVAAYGDAQYRAGLAADDSTDARREADAQVEAARLVVHQHARALTNHREL